jgi:hypothetical protein
MDSRTSDSLESNNYLRRSSDYAWQLLVAAGAILVRPLALPLYTNLTAHTDSIPPSQRIRAHPTPLNSINLPLLPTLPPRSSIIHIWPHHYSSRILPIPDGGDGPSHGRTCSRCCGRCGPRCGTRLVVGNIWRSGGEGYVGEMGESTFVGEDFR